MLKYLSVLIVFSCESSAFAQKKSPLSEQDELRLSTTIINAEKERILGNFQSAFKLFNECLVIDPLNDAAFYAIGKLYADQRQFALARAQFEAASVIDPKNKWYLIALGESHLNEQQYKESAKVYSRLRKLEPKNSDFVLTQANLYLYAGDVKQAVKCFDEYELIVGKSLDVGMQKYRHFVSTGKYSEAEKVLINLGASFPREIQIFGSLADLYKAQGKTDEAHKAYRSALKIDPNNPYVLLSLSEYFDIVSQTDSAFSYLNAAFSSTDLDIDTKVHMLLKLYVEAQQNLAVRKNALTLCNTLCLVHPQEAKAFSVAGDFQYLDDQSESARISYRKAIDLDPSRFALWTQLLTIDSELNDNEAMLADSEAAIELFPIQPAFYLFNGIAYTKLNNPLMGSKRLKQGTQLVLGNNSLSSQLLASLGDAYHELGDHESSDSALQAALSYDPNNLYVLNNYSYFLSERHERLEQALQMSKTTIERSPNNPSYLDTYGRILYHLGNYSEAEQFIKRSLENGGESSAEVLKHYGDVLSKLNRMDDAQYYWSRARETEANDKVTELKSSDTHQDD